MSKKIEIVGLEALQSTLRGLPENLNASVIRNVARKPANKIVSLARKLFPYRDTGDTKRSFGVLKIRNNLQKFIEVGTRGRSLAWIFLSGTKGRKTKKGLNRGQIRAVGNVFEQAADTLDTAVLKEMKVDLTRVINRALSRRR